MQPEVDLREYAARSAVPRVYASPRDYVQYARRGGLIGLLLKNAALIVLTVSLYRFWARTALRRFYWSSISIAGDRLEYTGRGIELFIGFLIALAILAPLGFAYNQLELMLRTDPTAAVALWVVYIVLLVAFGHIARYRARRYRLSRTRWRGIRLGQDGSTLAYLGLAFLWSLIQAVTLTLATPWKRAALRGYIVRHSWFGDRSFAFAPRPLKLLPYWIAVVLLGVVPLALFALANLEFLDAVGRRLARIGTPEPPGMRAAPLPQVVYRWLPLAGPLAWAVAFVVYRVAEARLFVAATSIGAVRLHSNLNVGAVLPAALGVLLILVVGGGACSYFIFTGVRSLFFGAARADPMLLFVALVVSAGLSLGAIALIYYVAMNALVRQTILSKFCDSLTITNLPTLDDVRQSAATAPRRGEGLADSFEFGG
jgi:uncharacterized membrane protein YjgN (DUF898 family)